MHRGGAPVVWALFPLLAAVGCGNDDESRLTVAVDGRVEVLRPLLTVTASSDDWTVVFSGEEIRGDAAPARSDPIPTPKDGVLTVEAVLARSGDPPLATGSVELDIRRDWTWSVTVHLTGEDPVAGCFGCLGHRAFPVPDELPFEPGDSLFLVWSGYYISDPVVY